jgi:RecA/RadA recombinase
MASNAQLPRASTGAEGLDAVLGGGLARNRLHLLEGSPGTGKTTVALQLYRRARQPESMEFTFPWPKLKRTQGRRSFSRVEDPGTGQDF